MSSKWVEICLFAGCWLGAGCLADAPSGSGVSVVRSALEETCVDAPADFAGDVLAIFSSVEPLDPGAPQRYGNAACGGVVFEFDNPDEEPLHGAWVQASGAPRTAGESDPLGEARCAERSLQADYWGYIKKDKTWTKLTAAEASAVFIAESEGGSAYCSLDALLSAEGTYAKLRVVARVAQGSETYPMHALVW
jgi:hypothetical protein